MLTWAPRVPSRNSRLANSAWPSRPSPIGSRTAIWSKYSAWSRSLPSARRTTLPGSGGTKTSGLGGGAALRDQEHVGVDPAPLVAAPDLRHDARQRQGRAVGEQPVGHHDVVE